MNIIQTTLIAACALATIYVATAYTQQKGPAAVNGCIYIAAGITLTNLQSTVFLCDINGRLKVTTTP